MEDADMKKYEAVFKSLDNGVFSVVCYGLYKNEKMNGCLFPTVEEAKKEYSSNAEYIGIK